MEIQTRLIAVDFLIISFNLHMLNCTESSFALPSCIFGDLYVSLFVDIRGTKITRNASLWCIKMDFVFQQITGKLFAKVCQLLT